MVSSQCPGAKGVFISGMRPWNRSAALGAAGGSCLCLRGSPGFSAPSGMAQEPPNRSAPGMRPWEQYWLTRRSDTPHFSAVSRIDKYPSISCLPISHDLCFLPGGLILSYTNFRRLARQRGRQGSEKRPAEGGRALEAKIDSVFSLKTEPHATMPKEKSPKTAGFSGILSCFR